MTEKIDIEELPWWEKLEGMSEEEAHRAIIANAPPIPRDDPIYKQGVMIRPLMSLTVREGDREMAEEGPKDLFWRSHFSRRKKEREQEEKRLRAARKPPRLPF